MAIFGYFEKAIVRQSGEKFSILSANFKKGKNEKQTAGIMALLIYIDSTTILDLFSSKATLKEDLILKTMKVWKSGHFWIFGESYI